MNIRKLTALTAILDASKSSELAIEGAKVICSVSRPTVTTWPVPGPRDVVPSKWPAPVDLACTWEGGGCALRFEAAVYGKGKREGDVSAAVWLTGGGQRLLVWSNLATELRDPAGGEVSIPVWQPPQLL